MTAATPRLPRGHDGRRDADAGRGDGGRYGHAGEVAGRCRPAGPSRRCAAGGRDRQGDPGDRVGRLRDAPRHRGRGRCRGGHGPGDRDVRRRRGCLGRPDAGTGRPGRLDGRRRGRSDRGRGRGRIGDHRPGDGGGPSARRGIVRRRGRRRSPIVLRAQPGVAGTGRGAGPGRGGSFLLRPGVPDGPLPADGLDPRVRGRGEVPVPRGLDAGDDPPVPGPGGDGRGRLRGPGAGRLHHLHVPRPRPCPGQGA